MGSCNQKDVAVTCMMILVLTVKCVVDVHACILYDLTEFPVQPSLASFISSIFVRISLFSPGWHSAQTFPAPTPRVLGLEVSATTSGTSSISFGKMTETNAKLALC